MSRADLDHHLSFGVLCPGPRATFGISSTSESAAVPAFVPSFVLYSLWILWPNKKVCYFWLFISLKANTCKSVIFIIHTGTALEMEILLLPTSGASLQSRLKYWTCCHKMQSLAGGWISVTCRHFISSIRSFNLSSTFIYLSTKLYSACLVSFKANEKILACGHAKLKQRYMLAENQCVTLTLSAPDAVNVMLGKQIRGHKLEAWV